jgi:capsular polysaccharide export protein
VPDARRRFANDVVQTSIDRGVAGCIDEVHTMTSLAGFEALLRGRQVTVYGGLLCRLGAHSDRMAMDRGRRLTWRISLPAR